MPCRSEMGLCPRPRGAAAVVREPAGPVGEFWKKRVGAWSPATSGPRLHASGVAGLQGSCCGSATPRPELWSFAHELLDSTARTVELRTDVFDQQRHDPTAVHRQYLIIFLVVVPRNRKFKKIQTVFGRGLWPRHRRGRGPAPQHQNREAAWGPGILRWCGWSAVGLPQPAQMTQCKAL